MNVLWIDNGWGVQIHILVCGNNTQSFKKDLFHA